ncbi:MAG TPA: hypothetical protein VHZ97_08865 [Pseudonocardiaceae bacterium]|nr:hypothetical protein [Pseudonocardiaceae bacterium]
MSWGRRRRPGPSRLGRRLVATIAGLVFLAGCSDPVAGTARPAVPTPVQPQSDTSTSRPPAPTQVSAACPLLPAGEVAAIYLVPLTAREQQPMPQTGATLYNCSYLNGASQQLAALQVVVNPTVSGAPQQYLDGFVKTFLAPGATAQPVTGLGTPAESYVLSNSSGPQAFVVAAVRAVGSTWDVVQFLVSEHNAGDPTALTHMTNVLRSALNRL